MDGFTPVRTSENGLFDQSGRRLYLDEAEREAFLVAARKRPARDRVLCEMLHYTGCRPSELVEITPKRVELTGSITIQTKKKRRTKAGEPRIVFRSVPVPEAFIDTLNTAEGIREKKRSRKLADQPLWPITRNRVWQIVNGVMRDADIEEGPQRTAKGLRHGFGVAAITNGVPLNMLCKWMGHESIETTAIYANALGKEEREIASRMWSF